MKGLVAVIAVMATAAMFVLITVIEIVERLAPLLIIGLVVWTVFAVMRARQPRQPVTADDPLVRAWARPPPPVAAQPSPFPPVVPHRERVYLVAGDDTGFGADRAGGYLNVHAAPLPAEHGAMGRQIRARRGDHVRHRSATRPTHRSRRP